jgi:hypothetical protein
MKTNEIEKRMDTTTLAFKYHDQTIQWLELVKFSQDEQKFLEHLLSSHFLDLSSPKLMEPTKKVIEKLKDIEKKGVELLKKVKSHNNHLGELVERNEVILEEIVKSEHKKVQKEIENYALKFKYVKKKIFGIIKDIMKAHKQKLLINKQ